MEKQVGSVDLTTEERIQRIAQGYQDVFGSTPPSLDTRFNVFSDQQREAMVAIEEARALAVNPPGTAQKDVQIIQFALYLCLGSDGGAAHHGAAAMRHGATLEDLGLATHLAFLAAGMPALLLGVAVMSKQQ